MSKPIIAKLREYLASQMELDPIPDAIAAYAATRVGKPVTKRDVDALKEAHPGMWFNLKIDQWDVALEWYCSPSPGDPEGKRSRAQWPNSPPDYKSAGSLSLKDPDTQQWTGERLTGTRWPTVDALKRRGVANARYFGGKDERNAARRAMLDETSDESRALSHVAMAVVNFLEMRQELAGARESYGDMLSEADYAIDKIIAGDL